MIITLEYQIHIMQNSTPTQNKNFKNYTVYLNYKKKKKQLFRFATSDLEHTINSLWFEENCLQNIQSVIS